MSQEMFDGPMRDLMVTMAAWRRLFNKAREFERNGSVAGIYILSLMNDAWDEAEKDLEKGQKELKKQMKKEGKK